MSPVVVVGFGALDAALISQAIYAVRDMRRSDQRSATKSESAPERHRPADAPGRIRTCDFRLRRAALYPLSYGRRGISL
jgi:hypothetical protein